MSENRAKKVFLSLGSNIGNRKKNLENAKYLLNNLLEFEILKTSNYYKSVAWPKKSDPFFLNIVIEGNTKLDPINLFKLIKNIEKTLGRKKSARNAPRKIDIDILDYDQKAITTKVDENKLIIPHPRLHKRNFVLLPLFEISKKWIHPKIKKRITKLLININQDNLRSIKIV